MSRNTKSFKKQIFYDQEEIAEQKQYELNPLAQLIKNEKLDLIRVLAYNTKDAECKYFHYLEKYYVQGYSLREIAKMENTYHEMVRARIERALKYLRKAVLQYTPDEDQPE